MAASSRPQSVSVYPILSVNFVGTLGFSIVLPFLVFLVTRLGGNALIYGVMGATYSFFQLIGAPILGRWSDRFGRRRILLLSQLGTLASWAIFLAALLLPVHTLWQVDSRIVGAFALTVPLVVLFLARALDGITGGNVSVANAYLADITPEDERSTAFGSSGPPSPGCSAPRPWGRRCR
jgi:MFS family permease